jgi:hypothetical protein
LSDVEPTHPAAVQKRVRLDESGQRLVWPVLFLYPEYGETDFIEEFDEDHVFSDHLDAVFAEVPPWDAKGEEKRRRRVKTSISTHELT